MKSEVHECNCTTLHLHTIWVAPHTFAPQVHIAHLIHLIHLWCKGVKVHIRQSFTPAVPCGVSGVCCASSMQRIFYSFFRTDERIASEAGGNALPHHLTQLLQTPGSLLCSFFTPQGTAGVLHVLAISFAPSF